MKVINKYWAIFGIFVALFILIKLVLRQGPMTNLNSLLWMHFCLLLIHQFEEYVFPGGFKTFFNNHIYKHNKIIRHPLNDYAILLINIILAWSFYLLSAILGPSYLSLANGLIGVSLLNGILHLLMALKLKAYNPGLISGALLFIPFSIYALITINYNSSFNLISIIIFFMATLTIPVTIYWTDKFIVKH